MITRMKRFALAGVGATAAMLVLGAAPALAAATDVSVSLDPNGSELLVSDSGNVANNISVSVTGNTITITDTAAGAATSTPAICTAVNATTITCPLDPPDPAPPAPPAAPVAFVEPSLGDGNDAFTDVNLAIENVV